MIIIKFQGGLGNQLFQYMLYRKYQILGVDVKADLSFYQKVPSNDTERTFDLYNMQIKELEIVSLKELRKFGKSRKMQRLYYVINRVINKTYYDQEPYNFEEKIFTKKNLYLCGFWQDFRYFSDIYCEVKKELVFKPSRKLENINLEEEMKKKESVSVHVRRGDYLIGSNLERYGKICTMKYYQDAIKYIEEKIENPYYYFFSDEPEWVEKNIHLTNMKIVECNQKNEQYMDLHLIQCCKHNIIANSSFSWWGAVLNSNSEKIVISPSYFEYKREIPVEKRIAGWNYLK